MAQKNAILHPLSIDPQNKITFPTPIFDQGNPNVGKNLNNLTVSSLSSFQSNPKQLTSLQRSIDNGFMKHIGYDGTVVSDPNYRFLWEPARLLTYQKKITELLQGCSPDGRDIIVPLNVIGNVLSQCYENYQPQVGDIYSRYILPSIENNRNDVRDIVDQMINVVVSQIRNEYETINNNNKLTIWNTLYGDFNKEGLRAHSVIKIRKRHPDYMQFNMNY
jgi:hypothetical protein